MIRSKWLSQTPDVARDSYDSTLPSFSLDGGTVDKTYEFAIESRKATVRTTSRSSYLKCATCRSCGEAQKEMRLQ